MEYRMKKKWKMGHWDKGHYISKGSRGYWSKYGGGASLPMLETEDWTCQSCGIEQISIIPSYKIPAGETIVRVCPLCKHTSLLAQVIQFVDLIEITRVSDIFKNFSWMGSLANLS